MGQQRRRNAKPTRRALYGGDWPAQSRAIRAASPWCVVCGSGRDLTVGVLGDQALAVVEMRPRGGFYGYKPKYNEGWTEYLVPALIKRYAARVSH